MTKMFPVIDPEATGENIARLRKSRGLTVRDLQLWFGFEEPQAIYKWQKGKSLPTVDNLYALGALLGVSMEEILVPKVKIVKTGQQEDSCCPYSAENAAMLLLLPGSFEYDRTKSPCDQFVRRCRAAVRPRKKGRGSVRSCRGIARRRYFLIN